jgi:NADH:ubiquinone oxidoreductase subunit 2 (subunit N)
MHTLEIFQALVLAIHVICVAGIVVLLLKQAGKSPKKMPNGLTHLALTALVAGLALVGIRSGLHRDDPAKWAAYNNGTVALKLAVVIVILIVAFRNAKKESITNGAYWALLLLTVANIGLASSLK